MRAVKGRLGHSLNERYMESKVLVGRAQWKINQPPSLKDNEQAWWEHL